MLILKIFCLSQKLSVKIDGRQFILNFTNYPIIDSDLKYRTAIIENISRQNKIDKESHSAS